MHGHGQHGRSMQREWVKISGKMFTTSNALLASRLVTDDIPAAQVQHSTHCHWLVSSPDYQW